ncbi:MAG: hypothetical protein HFE83_06840 [Lachnospiraceae bacterium]|nr:hypothetical protein [Lachnospiraceae bacterium]
MTNVLLYWSNICILHRQELRFLETVKESLKKQGILLTVTCFGLGYASHMSEELKRPDVPLPDMIVSADLEVFEDERIFSRFFDSLLPLATMLPVKETEGVPLLRRGHCLLPYLAIPLVFYGERPSKNLSLSELAKSGFPLAFGGINNSAAKSVVKTVWMHSGRDAAERLLKNSVVTSMPIEAFNRARLGKSPLALVPSIYARQADGISRFLSCPADGAVAVPSYICARSTISMDCARTVAAALRSPEISQFYVESGSLICCALDSPAEPWMKTSKGFLQLPSLEFLQTLPSEEFYDLYERYLSP